MTVLAWILAACLVGGLVSVLLAALVAFRVQARLVPILVSYAVGALLGAVFLDIIPHLFEQTTDHAATAATILAGLLGFFVLEKMLLWRHHHGDGTEEAAVGGHGHSHGHDGGRSGWMIVIGDSFHNFTDGVIIASAFLADVKLGIFTAAAIVAHEVPQEVGDFLVLLHSGFSKTRALLLNALSSLAAVAGRAARLLHAFRRPGVGAAGARHRRREHDLRRGRRPHSGAAAAHPARGIAHPGRVHRAGHPDDVGRAPARRAGALGKSRAVSLTPPPAAPQNVGENP